MPGTKGPDRRAECEDAGTAPSGRHLEQDEAGKPSVKVEPGDPVSPTKLDGPGLCEWRRMLVLLRPTGLLTPFDASKPYITNASYLGERQRVIATAAQLRRGWHRCAGARRFGSKRASNQLVAQLRNLASAIRQCNALGFPSVSV